MYTPHYTNQGFFSQITRPSNTAIISNNKNLHRDDLLHLSTLKLQFLKPNKHFQNLIKRII